jgi:outer membrane protein OmpA-like peptidoglycan-associated protein
VKSCSSDKNGEFKTTLPSGRKYVVQIKTIDYAFYSDTLSIAVSENEQDIKRSYELNRLENSQVSVLKGRIYDAVTGEDLTAKINLNEYGGQPVLMYYKPGRYDCIVHSGACLTMSVELNGYLNYSEQINIPESTKRQEIVHDIALVRAEKGAKVVLSNIFFDFNKSTLRPNSCKALNSLLSMLKQYPTMVVEISGHTDNVGSMEYNQKLSENRTNVVRDYLVRNGINPKNIAAFGRSFRQPIASNDTEQGRQMNRRTEFKIVRMN